MEKKYAEIDSAFITDYITSNKRKLLKIHNTIVLLDNKYTNAKKAIIETLNTIKNEMIEELDTIFQKKRQSLSKIEKEVEEHISSVVNACNHYSGHSEDVARIIENGPDDVRLLPFLSLNFIAEDISVAKSAIGFLKTNTVLPEELKLTMTSVSNKYCFGITSDKPWHCLLIHSLSAFAKDDTGRKFCGSIIDRKNGSYVVTFHREFIEDFTVSVTLYGRHISNSPFSIKVSQSKQIESFHDYLENSHSKLENIPRISSSTPKTDLAEDTVIKYFCNEKNIIIQESKKEISKENTKEIDLKKNTNHSDEFWSPELVLKKDVNNTTKERTPLDDYHHANWNKNVINEFNYTKELKTKIPNIITKKNTSSNNNYSRVLDSSNDEFWSPEKICDSIKKEESISDYCYKDLKPTDEFCNPKSAEKSFDNVTKEKIFSNNNSPISDDDEFWSHGKTENTMDNIIREETSLNNHQTNLSRNDDDVLLTGLKNDVCMTMGKSPLNNYHQKSFEYSKEESKSDEDERIIPITARLVLVVSSQNGVDLQFPIGVAVYENGDTIICDTGNHRVWIVDKNGIPKAMFNKIGEGKKLHRPSAVAIFEGGNIVIKDDTGLHLYDSNGIFIRSIGEKILTRPFGLALTKDEKLITLNENKKPTLYLFNKDGAIYCSNVYEPLLNRPVNSKCRFMTTHNGSVIVSDLGLSKMYKTTLDGKLVQIFGSYGKTPGTFNEPSGITLDPNGTMMIGDSKNNRIQVFDWEGEYLGLVKFIQPIHRPSDIFLSKEGYLYVLNYLHHFLGVYQLEMDE